MLTVGGLNCPSLGEIGLMISQIWLILQKLHPIIGKMLMKVSENNGTYTLIKFFFNWQPVYCFSFFKKYLCYFIQL